MVHAVASECVSYILMGKARYCHCQSIWTKASHAWNVLALQEAHIWANDEAK